MHSERTTRLYTTTQTNEWLDDSQNYTPCMHQQQAYWTFVKLDLFCHMVNVVVSLHSKLYLRDVPNLGWNNYISYVIQGNFSLP